MPFDQSAKVSFEVLGITGLTRKVAFKTVVRVCVCTCILDYYHFSL